MGSRRVERAARALLEHRDARMAALKATEDEDRPDARGFAWGALTSAESREEAAAVALRAALDAAPEPAQAGSFVCERGGCGKNGRVDPYGAGPDCKSGGLSPAGSEPATATTIKPSAGGA